MKCEKCKSEIKSIILLTKGNFLRLLCNCRIGHCAEFEFFERREKPHLGEDFAIVEYRKREQTMKGYKIQRIEEKERNRVLSQVFFSIALIVLAFGFLIVFEPLLSSHGLQWIYLGESSGESMNWGLATFWLVVSTILVRLYFYFSEVVSKDWTDVDELYSPETFRIVKKK